MPFAAIMRGRRGGGIESAVVVKTETEAEEVCSTIDGPEQGTEVFHEEDGGKNKQNGRAGMKPERQGQKEEESPASFVVPREGMASTSVSPASFTAAPDLAADIDPTAGIPSASWRFQFASFAREYLGRSHARGGDGETAAKESERGGEGEENATAGSEVGAELERSVPTQGQREASEGHAAASVIQHDFDKLRTGIDAEKNTQTVPQCARTSEPGQADSTRNERQSAAAGNGALCLDSRQHSPRAPNRAPPSPTLASALEASAQNVSHVKQEGQAPVEVGITGQRAEAHTDTDAMQVDIEDRGGGQEVELRRGSEQQVERHQEGRGKADVEEEEEEEDQEGAKDPEVKEEEEEDPPGVRGSIARLQRYIQHGAVELQVCTKPETRNPKPETRTPKSSGAPPTRLCRRQGRAAAKEARHLLLVQDMLNGDISCLCRRC
jgi:hypothetical protein